MAISRVQFAFNSASGVVNVITLGSAPTNGNLLIAICRVDGANISAITQTGANWVPAVVNVNSEIWYAENVTGASSNVTVDLGPAGTDSKVYIIEYSGFATGTIDQVASATGTLNTLVSGTTNGTTTANELWIANIEQNTPATFSSPTNGFTLVNQQSDSLGTISFLENIVSTTGMAGTAVTSTVSGLWYGAIVTFQGVIVPPPPPPICTQTPFSTAQDYIDELRNRFAEINFTTWLPDSQLISWMNQGIDDIVKRTLPPRNEMAPITFTLQPGVYTYPLPANFFRLKQFGDSGGISLSSVNYFNVLYHEDKTNDLEELIAETGQFETPGWFWFWNKMIYFYPIPDIAYNVKMYYYRLPVQVCANTDLVDLDRPWTECLVLFVCWKALEKDKHPMAQYYHQEYEQYLSNMYSESRVKIEKRARYVHSHGFYGRGDI